MEILVKHIAIHLAKLQKEIQDIEEYFVKNKLSEEEKKLKVDIEKNIEKHEDVVKARKATKFHRDRCDYAEGRIFSFAKRYEDIKQRENILNNDTDSDVSSLYSESDVSAGEGTLETPTSSKCKLSFLGELRLVQKTNLWINE